MSTVLTIKEFLVLPELVTEKAQSVCYLLNKSCRRHRVTVRDVELITKQVSEFADLVYFMLEYNIILPAFRRFKIYDEEMVNCSLTIRAQAEIFNLLLSDDIKSFYDELVKD